MEGFQLSQQQARLWTAHDRINEPGLATYLLAEVIGPLDLDRLQSACQALAGSHEIFRTAFCSTTSSQLPGQVIVDADQLAEVRLEPLSDQSSLSPEAGLINDLLHRRYPLEKPPLMHVAAAQFADNRHFFLLAFHPLCADIESAKIALREVAQRYEGEAITHSQIEYADYAAWQAEWLANPESLPARQFWESLSDQIAPALAHCKMPFETSGPGRWKSGCRQTRFRIKPEIAAALDAMATRESWHIEDCLVGTWHTLLARLSGMPSTLIGIPAESRGLPELQEACGPYAQWLPLPIRYDPQRPFRNLVHHLHQLRECVGSHQDGFCWKSIQLPESQSAQPIPFLFRYSDHQIEFTKGQLQWRVIETDSLAEPAKLQMHCQRHADGMDITLSWDGGLHREIDIQRLGNEYEALLEGFLSRPDAAIDSLPMVSQQERDALIIELNRTEAGPRNNICIHSVIENHAQRAPDKIAAVDRTGELTYGELNQRAEELASLLRHHGARPNSFVALSLERSLAMVVAILAVLKSGAAYVPLDPNYSQQRISFILEETEASILLKTTSGLPIPGFHGKTIELNQAGGIQSGQSGTSASGACEAVKATPEDLAYVIYTSGSTGKPKGVLVTHRNLMHSTAARFDYYKVPVERFLLLSSYAFDSSVAGIFWTLAQGGTLVLPDERNRQDPLELGRMIREHQITHLLGLPSLYGQLLEQGAADLRTLRTVIVAGEACSAPLVKRHFTELPETQLFNEYGPTEATVWSTVFNCADLGDQIQVPIGRPIPNAEVYVLDAYHNPVPFYVPGELYIGGAGVARGYLKRPDLTDERFLLNPFRNTGERMYRTGDLVRCLPNGQLEFLGRTDHQVKIRGYRIELEEIETVIKSHPGISEVAVAAHELTPGNLQLVAYVVERDGSVSPKLLREFLEEGLPEFMIPKVFISLEKMPLNSNGKIDRNALPAPTETGDEKVAPPETEMEEALRNIWSQVLHVDNIGRTSDFFDLGGHSLLAMQVASRIRKQFKVELSLQTIFERPVLSELAKAVEELQARPEKRLPTLTKRSRSPAIP